MRPDDETISDHLRQALDKAAELGIELPEEDEGAETGEGEDGFFLEEEDGDYGFPDAEDEFLDEF